LHHDLRLCLSPTPCFSRHFHRDHRRLHSFPTRRSSDLTVIAPAATCSTFPNTATIVEASQNASQSVKVCGASDLTVTKTDCDALDRKSTRLNSSHSQISYAVFCLKKKFGLLSQAVRVFT